MNETVVETKFCNHCQSSFDITQGDIDFYNKISPKFNISGKGGVGEIFVAQIPTPTLCPDCRQRRRMSFRNERKLYRRICDATQQPIISLYSPDKPYKVYDQKLRNKQSFDFTLDYWEFSFEKLAFSQFHELILSIPKKSLSIGSGCENCSYNSRIGSSKNCYYVFNSHSVQDSLYCTDVNNSLSCLDCLSSHQGNHCYMTIDCYSCTTCFYCRDCTMCNELIDCIDCDNCQFCVGCSHQKNQSYMINNIHVSPQQYHSYLQNYSFDTLIYYYGKCAIYEGRNSHCTNVVGCSDCQELQNSKYCLGVINHCSDCYDVSGVGKSLSLIYEGEIIYKNCYLCLFCIDCWDGCRNVYYSIGCKQCSDCLFCCNIEYKQYCIFNKQYTKDEYEMQVAKIIQYMMTTGEWGEFFHPSLSPFGYNETVAQEYYPLVYDEESESHKHDHEGYSSSLSYSSYSGFGYHRSTYEAPVPNSDKVINGQDLPHIVTEVEDSMLQYAIKCEITGKLFRIQVQELAFYRKHNIPLPRKHPDQRHLERLALRR